MREVRRALIEGHASQLLLRKPDGGLKIPQLQPEHFKDEEAAGELYLTWGISIALDPLWDGRAEEARDGELALRGRWPTARATFGHSTATSAWKQSAAREERAAERLEEDFRK